MAELLDEAGDDEDPLSDEEDDEDDEVDADVDAGVGLLEPERLSVR